MKYYLKSERGRRIYKPEKVELPAGEEVEVSKSVYDKFHDSDGIEGTTEKSDSSSSTEEEEG